MRGMKLMVSARVYHAVKEEVGRQNDHAIPNMGQHAKGRGRQEWRAESDFAFSEGKPSFYCGTQRENQFRARCENYLLFILDKPI